MKRVVLLLFVVFTFIGGYTANANDLALSKEARYTETPGFGKYRLASGVGRVNYWISSSAQTIKGGITEAANNWVVTGWGYNPIYMYETTSSSNSHMDIYYNNLPAGINGQTQFYYIKSGVHSGVSPYSSNWYYGVITLSKTAFTGMWYVDQIGVIGHEMGHVYGLDHNNFNSRSIMCQAGSGRAVYKPGLPDHYGINNLY